VWQKTIHKDWNGLWYHEDRVEVIRAFYFIAGLVVGMALALLTVGL